MKNNQKKISDNALVVITGGFCNKCICFNNTNRAIQPVAIGPRSYYQECKADCLESGSSFNDFICLNVVNVTNVISNNHP